MTTRNRVFAVVLVGTSLASQALSNASTVLITDSTWKVTGSSPSTGWNTDIGFDDSAFISASINYPSEPMDGYLTNGIWDSTSRTGGSSQTWFRRVFTLTGNPTSGILDVAIDDDVDVFINGIHVLDDNNGFAQQHLNIDVTAALQEGANLIAAHAVDGGGFHSFHARMEVAAVPEPSTTALAVGAVACGTVVFLRRHRRA